MAAKRDPGVERFEREMNAGMERMMHAMHAPGYSGEPDADFLAMMIPHHEGAVEMARPALIHGRDPGTRRLVEDIIATQQHPSVGPYDYGFPCCRSSPCANPC